MSTRFDALIVVSFGGPEGPDDVMPFLRRVTAGRGVPDERLTIVAEQYLARGGISPINEQNRLLVTALESELERRGRKMPVYWGNRNWDPDLQHAVRAMADDGVEHAAALVTSAYSSYSGCRQYLDDIATASQQVGSKAPSITKLRQFFDHPGFIEPMTDHVSSAVIELAARGADPHVVFCAHSIPTTMADRCSYESQIRAAAALITAGLPSAAHRRGTSHAWQSRSGAPGTPWLDPDINDHLAQLARSGATGVVVVPLGFISAHMEVVHDLDTQAAATAADVGLDMIRSRTVDTDDRFIGMVFELVDELESGTTPRALSTLPIQPTPCAGGCCPSPKRG